MRRQRRFMRGDDSGRGEGDRWARLNWGELGKGQGIVPGVGDSDAEGGRCGQGVIGRVRRTVSCMGHITRFAKRI
jgi:hypothetical protein